MVNSTVSSTAGENGNGHSATTYVVVGRRYATVKEAADAKGRRVDRFLQCGGVLPKTESSDGPVLDEAAPESFDAEPDWPITTAIDEAVARRLPLFTATALDAVVHHTRELIPGILTAGQTSAILGPFRTLKTSLALDLAIAVASGTPFLGRFPVAETGRVLFLAGAAALAALQAKVRRICTARGLSLGSLENLVISPQAPRLDSDFDRMALEEVLLVQRPLLLVIDASDLAPAGKTPGKTDAGDVREQLAELTRVADEVGCTVLIVEHSKPPRRAGDPATLDELAGHGLAECAAQWLLVARRRPFAVGSSRHDLWLTTGNRMGDQTLWELDVDESLPPDATLDRTANARRWQTTVRPVTSFELRSDEQWVAADSDRHLRRRALSFERQCQRTLELLSACSGGRTPRNLRDTLGMSGDRITRVLDALIERGQIVQNKDYSIDRIRPIITYSRLQANDLSSEAISSSPTSPDPKIYDATTGQFVDRSESSSPCPNFAEIRRVTAARRANPTVELAPTNESQPANESAPANESQPTAESATDAGADTGYGI